MSDSDRNLELYGMKWGCLSAALAEALEQHEISLNRHCEDGLVAPSPGRGLDVAGQGPPAHKRRSNPVSLDAALEMTGANVPRTFAAVCGAHGDLHLFAPLAMTVFQPQFITL